jgi:cardiolipin synthase A/B
LAFSDTDSETQIQIIEALGKLGGVKHFKYLLAALALVFVTSACLEPQAQAGTPIPARLFIEPKDGIQPVLDAINSSKISIRHKIYLFTDSRQDVIDALVAAKSRGVDVKILLEREPAGGTALNTGIYLKLIAAGLNVQYTKAFKFVYVHEKSFVIDDLSAIISTANITGSSFSSNREYLVQLEIPELVTEIAKVFDADWAGADFDLTDAKLVWSPSQTTAAGLVKGSSRAKILNLINGATQSLMLEQEAMADEEVILALIAAQARGVAVGFVGSPKPATDTYIVAGAERLKAAGVKVRWLQTNFVHAKAILSDDTRAFIGSENISTNSLNANRELGIILEKTDSPDAISQLKSQIEADLNAGTEVNPFTLPALKDIQPAENMSQYLGREVTLEGLVVEVEKRDTGVSFLKFGTGELAPRAVIFARNYDSFAQPFPDFYNGKHVQITGRVQLYGEYYEVILDSPSQIKVL